MVPDPDKMISQVSRHGFALVRDATLDDRQLAFLAKSFGVICNPIDTLHAGGTIDHVKIEAEPRIAGAIASNAKFHQEDSCAEYPPQIIGIYCKKAYGAKLYLCSTEVNISESRLLAGIKLTHTTEHYRSYKGQALKNQHDALQNSGITNANCLFANELFTSEIVFRTNPTVNNIYSRIIYSGRRIEHVWVPGDLVIFDNYSFLHCGNYLGSDHYKELSKFHTRIA